MLQEVLEKWSLVIGLHLSGSGGFVYGLIADFVNMLLNVQIP